MVIEWKDGNDNRTGQVCVASTGGICSGRESFMFSKAMHHQHMFARDAD